MDEFYDLETDPFEMNNRLNDPQTRDDLQRMRTALQRVVKATLPTPVE
jgi:hypothetical protein